MDSRFGHGCRLGGGGGGGGRGGGRGGVDLMILSLRVAIVLQGLKQTLDKARGLCM